MRDILLRNLRSRRGKVRILEIRDEKQQNYVDKDSVILDPAIGRVAEQVNCGIQDYVCQRT
jgi:hypothetical protein